MPALQTWMTKQDSFCIHWITACNAYRICNKQHCPGLESGQLACCHICHSEYSAHLAMLNVFRALTDVCFRAGGADCAKVYRESLTSTLDPL